jgi:hypothetical protein
MDLYFMYYYFYYIFVYLSLICFGTNLGRCIKLNFGSKRLQGSCPRRTSLLAVLTIFLKPQLPRLLT